MNHVKYVCLLYKVLPLIIVVFILFGSAHADLEIYFLDVGQGDAAIILCDGESMMIDGGPAAKSDFIYSYLRNTLKLSLLDFMIATHPHEDHIGGLAAALNAVPVDLIFSPVTDWDSQPFRAMKKYAEMQGAPMIVAYEGDQFRVGNAKVTVIHSWPEAWEVNDMSIVVRIVYGETSFLFTGDAEIMSEYMMIDSGRDLRSTVLKVGHHGSSTSTCEEFLQAVSPEYAVISCGAGNSYGHPRPETMDLLRKQDVQVYRTDLQGTVLCRSDGKSVTFETEKDTDIDLFSSPYQNGETQ